MHSGKNLETQKEDPEEEEKRTKPRGRYNTEDAPFKKNIIGGCNILQVLRNFRVSFRPSRHSLLGGLRKCHRIRISAFRSVLRITKITDITSDHRKHITIYSGISGIRVPPSSPRNKKQGNKLYLGAITSVI